MSNPILTILIPSYNRAERVFSQITNLLTVIDDFGDRVELVVSNNKSTDNTLQRLSKLSSPYLTVFSQERHLDSVEEHIFHTVNICRGDYVWFLGDDDVPFLSTLKWVVSRLEAAGDDFLFFGSGIVDQDGARTDYHFIPLENDVARFDFARGAMFCGYTFGIAGISTVIMKRAPLEQADWRQFYNIERLYSHVAWWLLAFKGKTFTVVNRPLVSYRLDGEDTTRRMLSFAEKKAVPTYGIWIIGIPRQLELLEQLGAIRKEYISEMFELTTSGACYRFLDHVVHLIGQQVVAGVAPFGHRNRLSGEVLGWLCDWLLRLDPGYFHCVEVIKDIHALRPEPDRDPLPEVYSESSYSSSLIDSTVAIKRELLGVRLTQLLHAKSAHNDQIGLLGYYRDHALYEHISGFVAFDENQDIVRRAYLRRYEIPCDIDGIYSDDSLEGLKRRIDSAVKDRGQRAALRTHPAKALRQRPVNIANPESRSFVQLVRIGASHPARILPYLRRKLGEKYLRLRGR